MEEVVDDEEVFFTSLSDSDSEQENSGAEGDNAEDVADVEDEDLPFLWSACNDRGSNVVKGMHSLFEDELDDDDDGEISVPCDANNCVCHLCKGAVDALLGGRFGAATFSRDCTVVLGVSSAFQRKGEGRDLLQDVATAETSHLVPLRKGDTRWEGLHQCWGRAIHMKDTWKNFFEDEDAGHECLQKAGIEFVTDFPSDSFWLRGEFYLDLLSKAHAFSKWAQLEREPNMMFLVEKVASLVKYFSEVEEEGWKKQCRASFRISFRQLLMDRVIGGDAPFAVRAALFNPLIDVRTLVTPETLKSCEEAIVREMANFFPQEDKVEYDDSSLTRVLTLVWEQFKVTKEQFERKIPSILNGRVLAEMPFQEKVEILREFWARPKHPFPAYLVTTCKAYWSAPVASSKSESMFSYAGEVITKKRNKMSVQLAEAMSVGYDWSRQKHFKFEKFVNTVFVLEQEHTVIKEKAKEEKEKEKLLLTKRLRELSESD